MCCAGVAGGEDLGMEEEDSEPPLHRLCPTYAQDINSPLRHVRTRIYFTSESHVHSLINVLRFCHLGAPTLPPAHPGETQTGTKAVTRFSQFKLSACDLLRCWYWKGPCLFSWCQLAAVSFSRLASGPCLFSWCRLAAVSFSRLASGDGSATQQQKTRVCTSCVLLPVRWLLFHLQSLSHRLQLKSQVVLRVSHVNPLSAKRPCSSCGTHQSWTT